jgi:uncharacterized protein
MVLKIFPLQELKDLFKGDSSRTILFITFIMIVLEYFGWQGPFHHLFSQEDFYRALSRNERTFYAQVYTSISFLFLFILLPGVYHLITKQNRKEFSHYGLNLPSKQSWAPYIILGIVMIPLVLMASSRPSFYKFYPLYRPINLKDWLLFEAVYLTQFVGVEFFFRGFNLFRLEKSLGPKAIIFMTLPYALIHIHKPFPEAIGSIFAGIMLGLLALKGRSIWPGVLLHGLIAFSADTFGLYFSGFFTSLN